MELFRTQRVLMTTAALMGALVVFGSVAMLVDDRMVLGVSVWTKPVKFGLAFLLYTLTLAWLLHHEHRGRRWTRIMGGLFAATAIIDVGFIVLQAARGTFSHFNTQSDPVNAIGQVVFMSGVPGLFAANLIIAAILIWQRIGDRATTLAMRFGLAISVVGMGLGYLVGFAGPQVVRDAAGHAVKLSAKHTIGADDGSTAAMPITGWSLQAGDLRVAHFVGLHGMQLLLLTAFGLAVLGSRYPRLAAERVRAGVVAIAGVLVAGVVAITLTQAMRGESVLTLRGPVLVAAVVLAMVVVAGLILALRAGSGRGPEPVERATERELAKTSR